MSHEVTNGEILSELREYKKSTDARFEYMDTRFEEVLGAMHAFAEATDKRFTVIELEMGRINSQMVTKDYLDRKLWDLQGDMVAMTRREIERHEMRFHAA